MASSSTEPKSLSATAPNLGVPLLGFDVRATRVAALSAFSVLAGWGALFGFGRFLEYLKIDMAGCGSLFMTVGAAELA